MNLSHHFLQAGTVEVASCSCVLFQQLCCSSQVKDFGKGMTPINRAGQPRELAPTFVYLANNAGVCSYPWPAKPPHDCQPA